MVANGGLLYVKQRSRPTDYIITILGSNSVSNDSWALLTFQDGMVKDTREMLMPNLMNSMRLPDFIALCRHSLLWPITLSVSVTLCVSAYAFLVLTYEKGGLNLETYAVCHRSHQTIRSMLPSHDYADRSQYGRKHCRGNRRGCDERIKCILGESFSGGVFIQSVI